MIDAQLTLQQSMRMLATQWFEYLEENPIIGGRLMSDETRAGPTWREVAGWALWLLRRSRPNLTHGAAAGATDGSSSFAAALASSTPDRTAGPSQPQPPAQQQEKTPDDGRTSQASSSDEAPAPASTAGAPLPAAPAEQQEQSPPSTSTALEPYSAPRLSTFTAGEPRGAKNKELVESWLEIFRSRILLALYPGMSQLSAGELRLYWTRVHKSLAACFSDKGRAAWAEEAAAGARTAAIRQGKRTPRQQAEATRTIKNVTTELKPNLPRSARGPGGKRMGSAPPPPGGGGGGGAFGIGAPKQHLATRHVRGAIHGGAWG